MSRLTDLIERVRDSDPALAADLNREVDILGQRRAFGLNFERHVPESVQLPQRRVRRGDKVVFLPERGADINSVDHRVWVVIGFKGKGAKREAVLVRRSGQDEPDTTTRLTDNLVVVAEFRDPIYPGLVSTGKLERAGDKPFHSVINGENYHALEALRFAYAGAVDCIYIDPPYNTRDKDWKYNNDYVDSDDRYRHSKWLAMLERRLRVAQDLLNPHESVLIVTIDEKEVLRLGLLLEQLFPASRIQMVSSAIKPSGNARGKEFYRVDEYIFFVYVGKAVVTDALIDGLCITEAEAVEDDQADVPPPVRWASLLRSGTGAQRAESALKFYPVLVDTERAVIKGPGRILDPDEHPEDYEPPKGLVPVWPMRQDGSEGRWQLSKKTFEGLLVDGRVKLGKINKKTGKITILYLPTGLRKKLKDGEVIITGEDEYGGMKLAYKTKQAVAGRPKTQWNAKSHSATDYGTSLLRRFIPGRTFPFPKSLYAVEDTLRFFVGEKPEAVILDFFAGSGTTAHAVMRLNRQDGGKRRSICVTNNEVSAKEEADLRTQGFRPGDAEWEELGIAEYITNPRLTAAISGETPDGRPVKGDYKFNNEFKMADGFSENIEFFKLTYEDSARVKHGLGFKEIAPLLWFRAGSQGRQLLETNNTFDVADTYGVLFNVDAAAGFVEAAKAAKDFRLAYIVTDDEGQFQTISRQLPSRVEPVRLFEAYLENARIGPRSTL